MNRDDAKVFLHAVLIALFVVFAGAALAHDNYDCATIRTLVAQHGKIRAIHWAREQGYSWSDIWRVRKVCRV
jgi:hypothetical protein